MEALATTLLSNGMNRHTCTYPCGHTHNNIHTHTHRESQQ